MKIEMLIDYFEKQNDPITGFDESALSNANLLTFEFG